jgi:hypothetical protein
MPTRNPSLRKNGVATLLVFLLPLLVLPEVLSAGPEFSREYDTPCTTCHVDSPELNDLGRAFKDAGFQFPEKDVRWLRLPRALLMATPQSEGPSESVGSRSLELDKDTSSELKRLRKRIKAQHFPFHFRLGHAVVEQSDHSNGLGKQPVIEITGRYLAAYSSAIPQSQRAADTLREVILPILRLAVTQFAGNPYAQGYAIEVSHDVRAKVLGITVETPENVALVLSETAADAVITSNTSAGRDAALQKAQFFINAEERNFTIRPQP